MAVYLPIVGVLLLGGDLAKLVLSVAIAITAVALVLVAAVRYGRQLSQFAAHESDEIILLTIFAVVLLVAGMAQRFQVSAPIGAFLVGILGCWYDLHRQARTFAGGHRTHCTRRVLCCHCWSGRSHSARSGAAVGSLRPVPGDIGTNPSAAGQVRGVSFTVPALLR